MSETVDHPAHYGGADDPYEVIKVIEAWDLNFNFGSVLKYVARAGKKDPAKEVEDLEKAAWCLNREIIKAQGLLPDKPTPAPKPAERYLDKVGDLWIRNGDGTYD